MNKDFGKWLRANRKRQGLSQEEVGERIGRTKAYISTLERNYSASKSGEPVKPDVKDVEKLARVLGVPVNEARDMAGYAPVGQLQRPEGERLLEYFNALPAAQRAMLLTTAKALYDEAQLENARKAA